MTDNERSERTAVIYKVFEMVTTSALQDQWSEEEKTEKKEMKKDKKWMTANKIGDEGVKALSKTMKVNNGLTSLNLSRGGKGKRKKENTWRIITE